MLQKFLIKTIFAVKFNAKNSPNISSLWTQKRRKNISKFLSPN